MAKRLLQISVLVVGIRKKVNGYDNTSIYSLYINGNKVCHAYDRKTFLEVINDLYNRGIIQM